MFWGTIFYVSRNIDGRVGMFLLHSGGDEDLVLCGGGNTSVKEKFVDVFGEKHDALYVKGSGWDLAVSIEHIFFVELDKFESIRVKSYISMPNNL
jgi:rhamnose utilization protein RhaD (predicted bifunctional aldolase and dehydrogenase)